VALAALLALGAHGGTTAASAAENGAREANAIYASAPIMFEANRGQSDARVKFLARSPGSTLFLMRGEAVLALQSSQLRLKFIGANPQTQIAGRDQLRAKTNYLLGNDPKQWHRGVPNYAAAEYQELYPGVNAVFHGSGVRDQHQQRLEFDFEVAAGADPSQVALQVEGARQLSLQRDGDVLARLDGGREVVLGKPRVYQLIAGQRREVAGEFLLRPRQRLAFALGPYDHSQRLIIDPTLEYSTYVLDGNVNGIAVGEVSGTAYAYIVGTTDGGLAVSTGAFQGTCPACGFIGSAFVAKYETSLSGTASLIYSTYFGPVGPAGAMPDELGSATGNAIAVDANGDAFITGGIQGSVGSSYLPKPSSGAPYLATMAGTHAAFVAELGPTGEVLLASTYLGGTNSSGGGGNAGDRGLSIALDGSDNVYIAGMTDSPNLATAGAPQTALNNGLFTDTPFVAKLNSSLSSLDYYTYLGGSNNNLGQGDTVTAIAVDGAGEAYVVGGTYVGVAARAGVSASTGSFPTPAAAGFQPSPGGISQAGFLAKLNAAGTQLLYLTYLGGGSDEYNYAGTQFTALALNAGGDAFVTGTTGEYNLPTTASVVGPNSSSVCVTTTVTTCPGSLVAEFAPTSGSASRLFLSYLGGLAAEVPETQATGIALDGSADIYVTGITTTSDMPEPGTVNTPNGAQPSSTLPCIALSLCYSPFLVELAPGATSVLYSGYLAGTGAAPTNFENDAVAGLALDSAGNVYLAGTEGTNDFPTTAGGFDTTAPLDGNSSSYLAEIGGLPSGASTPSVATYTLNGLPPAPVTFAGETFFVSAPATTSLAVPVILSGSDSPPWTLTSLTCNGAAVPLSISTPLNVGAGQSCTILLNFAPTVVQGDQTEGLVILDTASSTNASAAPGSASGQYVALVGNGTAAPPPAYATYSVSGTALVQPNFLVPPIALSTGVGDTVTQQLVLTNTGGEPLTISGMSLSNVSVPPPWEWSITSVSCPSGIVTPSGASPVILQPGQYCTIGLQFAPTALGLQDVALTVLDTASGSNLTANAGATGQEFILQGTGGQPYATFSSTQVNFGTVTAGVAGVNGGGSTQTEAVTVTNTGNAPLVISSAAIGSLGVNVGAFSVLGDGCTNTSGTLSFPVTLISSAPNNECTFTLEFAPGAVGGAQSATAFFVDNATQSNVTTAEEGLFNFTQELPLSGSGGLPPSPYPNFPYAYFSAGALSFDGSGVQTQTLTVTNIGGNVSNPAAKPLEITSIEFAGASAFTLNPEGCDNPSGTLLPFTVTLDTYSSCTFTFQFDPSVTGTTGPFYLQNGGPSAGAIFFLNTTFSNLGVTDDVEVDLLGPGAMPVCMSNTGSNLNLEASESGWEWSPMARAWSQTITIANGVPGFTLPGYVYLVFEGLNTTLEPYIYEVSNGGIASQGTGVPSGYIPTALPALCGDTPGSPFIAIDTSVTGPPGGVSGLATTETITIRAAPVLNANGQQTTTPPSYSLKAVAGVGNP
jgi:hypothetical protein